MIQLKFEKSSKIRY